MDLTTIVYAIIIALYVVIASITILALVGKVEIKPSYMKVLFTKVILGIIGGFMYLFYSTGAVSFNKNPSDVYVYDRTGQATSFSIFQGDTTIAEINPPDKHEFKNVIRNYEKDENKMYILGNDSTYLGYINISGAEESGFINIENKLHLGLYYSQNKEKPGYANLAVDFLIEVLEKSNNAPELADAVKGLYNVVKSINKPENFKLLLKNMKIYLTPPSKYYEIAETFRVYYSATNTDRDKKNLGALRNYLQYVINNPKSIRSTDEAVRAKNSTMITNIMFYVNQLKYRYGVLADPEKINRELENYNTDNLQIVLESLPQVDIDELDA